MNRWIVILLCAANATAATITVRPPTADSPGGQPIQQAIAEAAAGDTIVLCGPGVFPERLTIDKPVALIGTNSAVIDGGGIGRVVTITAPTVTLRDIAVLNSGTNLGAYDSAIMISARGVTVANCTIKNDGFGIYLRAATNCVVRDNEIVGRTNLASAKRGNGIHLWKARGHQLINNAIHDKRDGIYFSFADENTISGNLVWDNRFGIHYMYSHQNRLVGNTLTRNAVGATLMFSRRSLVERNMAVANRRHGMLFKQLDNSRVLRNIVAGQNRGFFIQQAVQNRFEGNVIATNDIGVYLSNCSEENVFVANAFMRNTDHVWQPPDEVERGRAASNAFSEKNRGNYWSDYTGVDQRGDGVGDTPYHETDVYGYLLERHPEVRAFALSPALALLRKGEELLPLLDTAGVTDLFPLMQPPTTSKQEPPGALLTAQ